jgi:lysophospholipase
MPNAYPLSSEHQLAEHYQQRIMPFWQDSVVKGQFKGVNDTLIKTAYCLCPHARGSIVISPRLIDQPQKGYVGDFNDYIVDLKTFYDEVVNHKAQGKRFLLGHSMGATIATLYLQHYPNHFHAATLSAPMFGFNTGKLPKAIVKPLFLMMIYWKKITHRLNDYVVGQQDHQQVPFKHNALTHSQIRYQHFCHQYQQQPQLQLGGITYAWLATSTQAIDQLFANLYQLKTPLLMLQASDDTIVSLDAQQQFYWQMQAQGHCQKVLLKPARHEVLFEEDLQRDQAITAMIDFFANHE